MSLSKSADLTILSMSSLPWVYFFYSDNSDKSANEGRAFCFVKVDGFDDPANEQFAMGLTLLFGES